ncbi:MAG: nitroreductase family deazaflavin-dependent oxidoreductase [Chloroflexi bacterium]|nr:nitroreductase family deazaflavin-dependent oxidoreductase [Chloroflexota bacterium]
MVNSDTQAQAQMVQFFKYFNRFMLLMWRLGLGPALNLSPDRMGRIMVLTHTGRKSGLRRRTPTNYAIIDDDIYLTAGFGAQSQWYKNIMANPQVEVWLPEGWWAGEAADVTDEEGALDKLRVVLVASGFVAPMLNIEPQTMSDEDFRAATTGYRLLRIRRTDARTGPDGPGELAWVWPLLTLLLLLLLIVRPRR